VGAAEQEANADGPGTTASATEHACGTRGRRARPRRDAAPTLVAGVRLVGTPVTLAALVAAVQAAKQRAA
jgi:hypothetical protein